jgi:hypothetical protein
VLLVLTQCIESQLLEVVYIMLLGFAESLVVAPGKGEFLYLSFKFAELRLAADIFFKVRREFVGQSLLMELFQALKILDMTVVTLLASESSLAID